MKMDSDTEDLEMGENSQRNAEKFIVDLAELSEAEILSNMEGRLNAISDFLLKNTNSTYGTHVIRIAFTKLLPHLPIESLSHTMVQFSLEHLSRYISCSITEMKEITLKNVSFIECLIIGIGACDALLNHLDQLKAQGRLIDVKSIEKIPVILIDILISIVQFLKDIKVCCNQGDDAEELQRRISALLKEALGFSLKISINFKNFDWVKNEYTLTLLADVCERVSHLAHLLVNLPTGMKASLETWKAFASLIQIKPEDLQKKICLNIPIKFLSTHIKDEIQSLCQFSIESPSDEKIFIKITRTAGFYLKIVTRVCQLYKGYLRECHSDLLSLILSTYRYRYSSTIFMQLNIPDQLLKHLEQNVIIGVEELVSHLINEKDFLTEINNVSSDYQNLKDNCTVTTKQSERFPTSTASSFDSPVSSINFLMLHTSIIKQLLCSNNSENIKLWEPILIENICYHIPYCHAELSIPLKLPGVMYGGLAQEDICFYSHICIYVCSFVCTLNEDQYKHTEEIIFSYLLSENVWCAQFAMDILCFITRYGKSSLCESHCSLIMRLLEYTNDKNNKDSVKIFFLSRLLGFISHQKAERLLEQWLAESKYVNLLARVISRLTFTISEELQSRTDQLIIRVTNEKMEKIFCRDSGDCMKSMMSYLEAFNLYCGSPSVEMERIDVRLQQNVMSSILKLFKRIPVAYIKCSVVTQLFSLTLHSLIHFIKHVSSEDMFVIVTLCCELIKASDSPTEVFLAVCNFISTLGNMKFSDVTYGEMTLRKLEEIFAKLISSSDALIQQNIMTAMVAFGKDTVHEEVFPNCMDLCSDVEQETFAKFLQMVPKELPEDATLSSYFQNQQKYLLQPQRGLNNFISINLPVKENDVKFSCSKDSLINVDQNDTNKNVLKRRRVSESDSSSPFVYSQLMTHLNEVKRIIKIGNQFSIEENKTINQTFVEINDLWNSSHK